MTTVKDIYEFIDSFAPFETAESFDNTGILVGNFQTEITKAMVSLDITSEVIEEAVKFGSQLIVSHHPVIFNPVKRVMSDSVVYKLIENGISAICAHTNLDKSPVFGVNTELAKAITLKNIRVSQNNDILFLGETEDVINIDKFANIVKRNLDCQSIAYTAVRKNIQKVGLCSGAGGSEVFSAIGEHCDAFVTGEIKHHEIIAANESGMSVFVLGHYKSEDVVIEPLRKKLSERFFDVEFKKSQSFNDKIVFN